MNRWLEIDLSAIAHNIELIKKEINWPKVKLMPVIKANAYGHGLLEIAKLCQSENVDYLAVATFDEAMKLKVNNIKMPILIIGYIDENEIEKAILNNITLSIYDIKEAEVIIRVAQKIKKIATVHLKLDTGMHRLGFSPSDFFTAYKKLINNKNLKIEYIYSHFAEISNLKYSEQQLAVLSNILKKIKKENLPQPKIHFSRSEALKLKETHFDMVRPGLALYGLADLKNLKPALTFKTKIAQIKIINKGDFVGYGLTFCAKSPMKIATIAVGYADGYSRSLSNKGEVIIRGIRCSVIGRVCMNLTIVDISKVRDAKIGDEVVLIGKDKNEEITAAKLAKKINTIPYEIVARIPAEVPRVFKK